MMRANVRVRVRVGVTVRVTKRGGGTFPQRDSCQLHPVVFLISQVKH